MRIIADGPIKGPVSCPKKTAPNEDAGAVQPHHFASQANTTENQNAPAVASDSAGNFVVVWASYTHDGSGTGVFGQRHASNGAPRGTEFQVNTYTTNYQYTPAVASDGAGNFVVAWESFLQDGDAGGVFGQRFTVPSAAVGPSPAPILGWRLLAVLALTLAGFGAHALSRRRRGA
jgi:hypothetical protein